MSYFIYEDINKLVNCSRPAAMNTLIPLSLTLSVFIKNQPFVSHELVSSGTNKHQHKTTRTALLNRI